MDAVTRKNPSFSACGLNCGLCPRFYTEGSSRCPGCGGEGFAEKHPACGVLSCSRRKQVEVCCLCGEFPCKRFDGADEYDSFITHKNQLIDLYRARDLGLNCYEAELGKKTALLKRLLAEYDDGRRKSFFCLAVNMLPLQELVDVLHSLEAGALKGAAQKDKAGAAVAALQGLADKKGVVLKLRKKLQCE